jgi:ABC-type transporter Mla maintaining outer membrane lipid asymmetry ATPase subunit MlaF
MDGGEVIAIGTPEEIRTSQHPRVVQFLNRIPEDETRDMQAYLRTLTRPST